MSEPSGATAPDHLPDHRPDHPPAGGASEPDLVDLGLPDTLREAVLDLGWVRPTPVQAAAIPPLLAGRDLVGVARTGTGKTAAFGLPLLTAVDPARHEVQAVVLTPTRELAQQVAEALTSFARRLRGLRVLAVYGGAPFLPQKRALDAGAQVVVGTPGRVIDHLDRGTLTLGAVRFLVLDEADEMLRMGFAEDVERIASAIPSGRQVALFSATMPAAIVRVAEEHLADPVRVAVDRESSTVDAVRQTYAVVPHRHKIGALARVLATSDADAAIVFTRTRKAAEEVGLALVARGVNAATVSGDVAQRDRERIVERLRAGTLDVLVATDVAARGLDVERVGLVVNLDVPTEPEAYVHRIGRTGRAGRTGEALTFVTPKERHRLRAVERTTRTRLEEVTVPTPADVSRHRVETLLARTPARLEAGRLDLYREAVTRHLEATGAELLDVVAALAALAVGDEGPSADVPDDVPDATAEPARLEAGRRYRLAVGRHHHARPESIVGALTGEGGLVGADIGRIDIRSTFTLVDITVDLTEDQLGRIADARVGGRALHIRPDERERPHRRAGAGRDLPGKGTGKAAPGRVTPGAHAGRATTPRAGGRWSTDEVSGRGARRAGGAARRGRSGTARP